MPCLSVLGSGTSFRRPAVSDRSMAALPVQLRPVHGPPVGVLAAVAEAGRRTSEPDSQLPVTAAGFPMRADLLKMNAAGPASAMDDRHQRRNADSLAAMRRPPQRHR